MPKKGLLLCVVFSLLVFPLHSSRSAARPQATALDLQGVLDGAPYRIRVPANWNGTLLVYAHGYRDRADHPGELDDRTAEAAPGGQLAETLLLSQGYAIVGSAFRANGWAVREGLQDTLALTEFFKREVATPQRTILWGFSLGSLVVLRSAEKYAEVYDGIISGCGVGAGATRLWDLSLALSLAYEVAFGWPPAWGSSGDVRDDLDFESEVAPIVCQQVSNPQNFGRFEFIRLVNRLPIEGFYPSQAGCGGANWLFTDLFYTTEVRAELERRAGGPVVQNRNHIYTLTDSERAYLASLGVDAEQLLAAMNAKKGFAPSTSARTYLEQYADFTGRIARPVLTLHTIVDGLIPVANQTVYRATVEAAGREPLLLQTFTGAIGHCAFTPEQLLATIKAMELWIGTGQRPVAQMFPAALGFVPDFLPPAWPQPFEPTGCAADVSDRLRVTRGGFRFNRRTGRFVQSLLIENTSTEVVEGPVTIVLDDLSSNVKLINAADSTSCALPLNRPYVTISGGADNVLNAGERVRAVLEFSNPTASGINYTTRMLAGGGIR